MRWAILPEKLEAMLEVLEARAALGGRLQTPSSRRGWTELLRHGSISPLT
jgi:hypothetical protein